MSTKSGRLHLVDMLALALRVFRTRPSRTLLTIFGMSFGVGVVLFLVSLGFGLQFLLIGNLAKTEDSLISLETYYPPESGLKIDKVTLEKMETFPNVAEISPVGEFSGELKDGELSGVLIVRIINDRYFKLSGRAPEISVSEDKMDGVVVSRAALQLLNLVPDASSLLKSVDLALFVPKSDRANEVEIEVLPFRNLSVLGILTDESEPPLVYISAERFGRELPFAERVIVRAKDMESVKSLRDMLTDEGFSVSARLDLVEQANGILKIVTIILGIFGIAALVVSAIGMMNTMIIGFLERIYEVGIMKAIGATDRDIRNIFLVESVTMGFLGGAGGILLGTVAGYLFNFGLNVLASRLGGKAVELFIRPSWFMLLIIVVASVIGLLSGIVPAMRASKLSPKEAFARR